MLLYYCAHIYYISTDRILTHKNSSIFHWKLFLECLCTFESNCSAFPRPCFSPQAMFVVLTLLCWLHVMVTYSLIPFHEWGTSSGRLQKDVEVGTGWLAFQSESLIIDFYDNCEVIDTLIGLIVIIISHWTCISKNHGVHLKYIEFLFPSDISVNLAGNRKKKRFLVNTNPKANFHISLVHVYIYIGVPVLVWVSCIFLNIRCVPKVSIQR